MFVSIFLLHFVIVTGTSTFCDCYWYFYILWLLLVLLHFVIVTDTFTFVIVTGTFTFVIVTGTFTFCYCYWYFYICDCYWYFYFCDCYWYFYILWLLLVLLHLWLLLVLLHFVIVTGTFTFCDCYWYFYICDCYWYFYICDCCRGVCWFHHVSPSICRQILCRTITWVVFLRMFWNFISSLLVKRGGSFSFLTIFTFAVPELLDLIWRKTGFLPYVVW